VVVPLAAIDVGPVTRSCGLAAAVPAHASAIVPAMT